MSEYLTLAVTHIKKKLLYFVQNPNLSYTLLISHPAIQDETERLWDEVQTMGPVSPRNRRQAQQYFSQSGPVGPAPGRGGGGGGGSAPGPIGSSPGAFPGAPAAISGLGGIGAAPAPVSYQSINQTVNQSAN